MIAIELESVRHVFKITTGTIRRRSKEIVALNEISLQIEEGELFGLLGPNGAVKTTAVTILTTLLTPTSGRVTDRLGSGVHYLQNTVACSLARQAMKRFGRLTKIGV